jgi:ParB/RepB/Spo0J family partition protein
MPQQIESRQGGQNPSGVTPTIEIDKIKVGDRHRKDLGDIDALAASIDRLKLMQPIVVTGDNRLVAGLRRLEAVRKLGWSTIPVHVVHDRDDALTLLRAEYDENTCRKDFTPSEAVAIGKALEELERPKAQERQEASRTKKGEKVGDAQGGGNLPPRSGDRGKTRERVAAAVGMSGKTYDKAKKVVEAAEKDSERLGPVKEEMDRTGNVDRAFRETLAGQGQREHVDGACHEALADHGQRKAGPSAPAAPSPVPTPAPDAATEGPRESLGKGVDPPAAEASPVHTLPGQRPRYTAGTNALRDWEESFYGQLTAEDLLDLIRQAAVVLAPISRELEQLSDAGVANLKTAKGRKLQAQIKELCRRSRSIREDIDLFVDALGNALMRQG